MFSPSEPNTGTEEEAGILAATVGSQAPKLMCFKPKFQMSSDSILLIR